MKNYRIYFHMKSLSAFFQIRQSPLKAFYVACCLLCLSAAGWAQKSPIKFGDIPMSDMQMKVYPEDTSAVAVVLEDFGISFVNFVNDDIQLNIDRHVRIKILKKEGLNWANASLEIYHNKSGEERITNFKASAYNLENGQIVESKLLKDGIFRERVNKYIDRQKFTIPNVRVGTVLEYSYHKTSEFYTDFPNWQFQQSIPTRFSEYWAMLPSGFNYEKYLQGFVEGINYEAKPSMNYFSIMVTGHHYTCKNVPAFKDEPFMTTRNDLISRLNFAFSYVNYRNYTDENRGTWKKVNEDLLKSSLFGEILESGGFLKDKVEELTKGVDDPLKKIAAISDYVKSNVEYNGEEDYYADPLKKILESKKGTSGDINLLFGTMLRKAGLEADMVLLSTRDHGFVRPQYPTIRQFDYVICAVRLPDRRTILLDATEKFLPYDVLPDRCINGVGLVISNSHHGWIDLVSKAKAKTVVTATMKLNADGQLKGKIVFSRDGFDAQSMRESYKRDGEKNYVETFAKGTSWQIEKTEFQDLADLSKQAKEIHDVSIHEHVSPAGDQIYVNPFLTSQITENPFKSDQRMYPVDFGSAQEDVYLLQLTIPEGYQVDELPVTKIFALPQNAARYVYSANQVGSVINIASTFQINRNIFNHADYPLLREFYNQVVAKQAEQIVLKKKP